MYYRPSVLEVQIIDDRFTFVDLMIWQGEYYSYLLYFLNFSYWVGVISDTRPQLFQSFQDYGLSYRQISFSNQWMSLSGPLLSTSSSSLVYAYLLDSTSVYFSLQVLLASYHSMSDFNLCSALSVPLVPYDLVFIWID